MKLKLPYAYKELNEESWIKFPGKLVGSSKPGGYSSSLNEELSIKRLEEGEALEEVGLSDELLFNLRALNDQDIDAIYSLLTPHDELLRKAWESFNNKKYITEIESISTGIEDFGPPSQEQLSLITNDVLKRLAEGENVLVHCQGGQGRTGTILAAIYMKANNEYDVDKAVKYIRENYSPHAIESHEQIESLREFALSLQRLEREQNVDRSNSFVEKVVSEKSAHTGEHTR